MNHLASVRAVAEIGRLAAEPGPRDACLHSALEAIETLTGCDGASLAAWDPVAGRHRVIAATGPGPGPGGASRPLAEDPRFLCDGGYRLARRSRWPLRRSEVLGRNPPLRNLLALELEVGEGLTACLFTSDLRYTGMLNLFRFDDAPIDDATVHALAAAVPALALMTDATGSLRTAADLLAPRMRAVVLAGAGAAIPLPGRERCELLAPRSRTLAVARSRAPRQPGSSAFLTRADDGALWSVVVIRPGGPAAGERTDALVVAAAPAAVELSERELEVLALMAEGATNPEIAERLVLSRHTVATHVVHVLEKLGAPTRAAAAAIAERRGLLLVG